MILQKLLLSPFNLSRSCWFLLLWPGTFLSAQSTGDYRSKVSGNWNLSTSWEHYNGAAWGDAPAPPTSSDGVISIKSGHVLTITAAVTLDQVIVEEGGQIIHSGAGSVALANGSGTDLQINGTWTRTANSFTISPNSGATISVGPTGVYEQALTTSGGSIPTANWDHNSILRLINNHTGNTSYTNLTQNFGIIEYNRPSQTTDQNDLIPGDVSNELRIISTGTGSVRLQNTSITGSYKQTGGKCKIMTSGSATTSFGGNFRLEGGSFWMSDGSGSSNTIDLTVSESFFFTGGDLQFSKTPSTSSPAFFKIKKDFSMTGGTISGYLAGASGFYFNGTGEQTIEVAAAIGDNLRNSFWYQSSGGPTALNEIYSGGGAQKTVTGTRTAPGGTWAAFPTSGTLLKTLTVDNPDGLTLTRNIVVNTSLTFWSGILYPDSYTVTIGSGGTSTGAAAGKYVEGPCYKAGTGSIVFPIGKNGFYAPLEIAAPSTSSTFKAEYFNSAPSNNNSLGSGLEHISAVEYWTLDRTTGSGTTSVTLSWDESRSEEVTSLSNLRVAHYTNGLWADEGNTGTSGGTTAGTVTSNPLSSFSPFTIGTSTFSPPLPVELFSFTVKLQQGSAVMEWQTAREHDSRLFLIEKSEDSKRWTQIGCVPAAGFSSQSLHYQFIDAAPTPGTSYYRLKLENTDESIDVFNIIPLTLNDRSQELIRVFPQLIGAELNICNEHSDETVFGRIVNSNGQQLLAFTLFQGTNHLDVGILPTGIYFLQVTAGASQGQVFKLIKQ